MAGKLDKERSDTLALLLPRLPVYDPPGEPSEKNKDRCWIYSPKSSPMGGYPTVVIEGVRYNVRRLMYWIYKLKPDLGETGIVKSSCQNPRCVNPGHMECVQPGSWRKKKEKVKS